MCLASPFSLTTGPWLLQRRPLAELAPSRADNLEPTKANHHIHHNHHNHRCGSPLERCHLIDSPIKVRNRHPCVFEPVHQVPFCGHLHRVAFWAFARRFSLSLSLSSLCFFINQLVDSPFLACTHVAGVLCFPSHPSLQKVYVAPGLIPASSRYYTKVTADPAL